MVWWGGLGGDAGHALLRPAVDCGPRPVTERQGPGGGQGGAVPKIPGLREGRSPETAPALLYQGDGKNFSAPVNPKGAGYGAQGCVNQGPGKLS
jgi:hypothetical protein